ncbi:hypothetical protein [Spirosoma profusum]|nr:hypothetical protein [Spirosoma profusum]
MKTSQKSANKRSGFSAELRNLFDVVLPNFSRVSLRSLEECA